MPAFATRTVAAVLAERAGLQRVELDDGSRAYVLTRLIGTVTAGDRVVVNTTAVDLGLGTGGWHVVHWNLARESFVEPGPGPVMKLRYTSLQVDTGAAEEDHRELLDGHLDLGGCPVVACSLHSQVACVVATLHHAAPGARVAYVMTDAAALPLAVSDLVAALRDRGLLALTLTAGQAFGGDLEAVNLASALALAVVAGRAEAVVVGPGPGVVGTSTALGASALEIASVVDTTAGLGGRPLVALRYSEADPRPRHQGVSRGTLAALGLAARPATLPVPDGPSRAGVEGQLVAAGLDRHAVDVVPTPDVGALLHAAGLEVTTMGRRPVDDPGFFQVAGAAGVAAGRAVAARRPGARLA